MAAGLAVGYVQSRQSGTLWFRTRWPFDNGARPAPCAGLNELDHDGRQVTRLGPSGHIAVLQHVMVPVRREGGDQASGHFPRPHELAWIRCVGRLDQDLDPFELIEWHAVDDAGVVRMQTTSVDCPAILVEDGDLRRRLRWVDVEGEHESLP